MPTYVPNATQATEPVESRTVESAALEFRTLKAYTAGLVAEANAAEASALASAGAAAISESNAADSASSAAADAEDIRTNWQNKLDAAAAAATAAGTSELNAAANAATATTQAGIATEQAGLATTAKTAAEVARDAAQLAAGVYATTAAGLAATTNGQYFNVPASSANDSLILYRNNNGAAVEVKRYPSAAALQSIGGDVSLIKLGLGDPDYYTQYGGAETIGSAALGSTGLNPSVSTHAAVSAYNSTVLSVTIRSGGAMVGEIHAYENNNGVITCVAVWPFTTPDAGTHVFAAGAGVVPSGFLLKVGGFLGIKQSSAAGTGLLYATKTPADFVEISGDNGVGSVVTRAAATNYATSWEYSTGGVLRSIKEDFVDLDARLTTVETDINPLLPIDQMVMLYPPDGVLPAGWYDTGNKLLGMRMLSTSSQVFSGGQKGATVLLGSSLYQDAAKTILADGDGELVRVVNDQSPNAALIDAPADASRPTLRIAGATKYLEFDGVDDRLQIPAAQVNTSAVSFVCSVMFTGAGNIPQILGDSSTSNGVFVGASAVPGALRLAMGGGTIANGGAKTGGSIVANTRYTISVVYDGATLKGWLNGTKVIDAVVTGSFAVVQPLLCYSGANVVKFQGRLYGAALIGKAISESERLELEAVVQNDTGRLVANTSAVTTALAELEQAAADAASAAAIEATVAIAVQQAGQYYGLINPATMTAYALGDSTVAGYAGGTAILTLVNSIRIKSSLAVPGHTIAQQKTVWQSTTINPQTTAYVIVQIGLNDLNPAEAASVAIARLQDLINTIRATVGASVPIIVSKMIPCRQRLINIYGATNGPIAQQKWVDMNNAIAGSGSSPITGVNGRISSHVPLMDDGAGNLKAEYDTGDGIHPNTAGRQVNATAWENALTALGLVV